MLNKAIIIGRLGRDPELRYTQGGTPVASFSMATSETFKNKDGEKKETTEWHNILVWNKLAEVAAEYLSKGSLVAIIGKITHREYEDKSGVKRNVTEIVAHELKMLGGGTPKPAGQGQQAPPKEDNEDIPF